MYFANRDKRVNNLTLIYLILIWFDICTFYGLKLKEDILLKVERDKFYHVLFGASHRLSENASLAPGYNGRKTNLVSYGWRYSFRWWCWLRANWTALSHGHVGSHGTVDGWTPNAGALIHSRIRSVVRLWRAANLGSVVFVSIFAYLIPN